VFSGRNLPNTGPAEAWSGAGSLARLDKLESHGHGTLISPEDFRREPRVDEQLSSAVALPQLGRQE